MPITLPRGELERWYGAAGLDPYRPEALRAHCRDDRSIPALRYNLLTAPRREERNPNDVAPLQKALSDLGFPAPCVRSAVNA